MICPNCGSKCSNDAASCSRCGMRFKRPSQRQAEQRQAARYDDRRQSGGYPQQSQRQQAPAPRQRQQAQSAGAMSPATEKKYIIVGAITLVVALILAIVLITSMVSVCSNCDACAKEASENEIVGSVGGDEWGGVEADVVDPALDPSATTTPAPVDPAATTTAAPAAPAA